MSKNLNTRQLKMRRNIKYLVVIVILLSLPYTIFFAHDTALASRTTQRNKTEIKEQYYDYVVEWKSKGLLSATDTAPAMKDEKITNAEYNELFEKMKKNRITFLRQ